MKRRLMAILMCLVMVLTLCACGAETENAAPVENEESKLKFGFTYTNWADATGARYRRVAEYTCEVLGIEPVFNALEGYDAEAYIAVIQNQIESGCDAVWAGANYIDVSKLCEEKGIIQMSNAALPLDQPDYTEYIKNMTCFGGIVTEDNYTSAVAAVDKLYEIGCRNVAIMSVTLGMGEMLDSRDRGFRDAIAKYDDMNLVVDYYGMPFTGEYNSIVSQWITMYPELDGILVACNDGGAMSAVYSEGATDRIKLAVFDIQDGVEDAIKDGVVAWCALGQENTIALNIIMAYNQIKGYDMVEDNTVEYLRPFLHISSPEMLEIYQKLDTGALMAYDEEMIKSLVVEFNPDASIEDIIAANNVYSFEDIAQRNNISLGG